jgi:hypothetical protein
VSMRRGAVRGVLILLALIAVLALGWTVVMVPTMVVDSLTADDLRGVNDPAKRLELRDARSKLQNEVRTGMVQAIAGLAVAVGIVLTYRQLRHNRDGQLTDRFTAAINQLSGDDTKPQLVLGGIYALERIANDSRADRGAIMEVLAAYVRSRAPWPPPAVDGALPKNAPLNALPRLGDRLPTVQAALTVLGRMPRPADARHRVDLRLTDLRGADLENANLRYARLGKAHLERAQLDSADLCYADVSGCDLDGASLVGVRMRSMISDANTRWPDKVTRAAG